MSKRIAVLLITAYMAVYIFPLGVRPLITPDEDRYGVIPREMIASGDWVSPHMNGIRYFEKPVLGYWLNAVSMLVFGENAFAVRLSSALAAGISALLIYLLMRRYGPGNGTEFTAPVIFLTMGLVYGIGTFAVLDSPTAMFVTGILVFFFMACREQVLRRKVLWLILAGVFSGLAFMTKGFLAFGVPAVTIVPFLLWEKRWKDIFILPWIPLAAAIIVALPWCLAIHYKEPDFWRYFFVVEHWERFLGKNDTQHPEPVWFYLPIILGGALPWALFLPCMVAGVRRECKVLLDNSLVRYSLCWLIFPFVAFSICSGKLATYVLPCFPPIAILGAIAFSRYFENDGKRIFNITAKVFGFIMIIGGVGFAIVQTVSACGMFRAVYDSSEIYKWIIACTAAVVWGVLSLFSAGASGGFRKIMLFGAGVALPLLAAHFCAPNLALHGKAQGIFYSKYKDLVKPDSIVVAYPNVMHAGMWEFKRNDILLYIHEGELEYGVKNYADSKDRAVSKAEFLDLLKKTPEGKIVFIMRGDFRDGNIPPAKVEKYEHGLMFFIY